MGEGSTRVGVVLVAHGRIASGLLDAAVGVLGPECLADVAAVDAGRGESAELGTRLCASIDAVESGRGVLLLVDVIGASPCECARRQAGGHQVVMVSGVNLAMLLKLGSLDRHAMDPRALAVAVADSGRRSIAVDEKDVR